MNRFLLLTLLLRETALAQTRCPCSPTPHSNLTGAPPCRPLSNCLTDPITLTMLSMFAALALAERLFPGRALPARAGLARGRAGCVRRLLPALLLPADCCGPTCSAPCAVRPVGLATGAAACSAGGLRAVRLRLPPTACTRRRAVVRLLAPDAPQRRAPRRSARSGSARSTCRLDADAERRAAAARAAPARRRRRDPARHFLDIFQHANLRTPRWLGYLVQRPESHVPPRARHPPQQLRRPAAVRHRVRHVREPAPIRARPASGMAPRRACSTCCWRATSRSRARRNADAGAADATHPTPDPTAGPRAAGVRRTRPSAPRCPSSLLHGVTDSWRSFEPVLPHLPRDLHVMALSQRGHGGSDKPAAGYRPADFAADVVAFLDAMDIERAVLVGHSMGSVNAMRCAIDHPSRVAGLLLAGTMPWFGRPPELLQFHREQIVPLDRPGARGASRARFQRSTLAQPIVPSLLDAFVADSLQGAGTRLARRLRRLHRRRLLVAPARDRRWPSLIVWGRHDAFCSAADQQALLRSFLRQARLVEYADVGPRHALGRAAALRERPDPLRLLGRRQHGDPPEPQERSPLNEHTHRHPGSSG